MDSYADSFSIALTTNINLASKLFQRIARIFEVTKTLYDQRTGALKGLTAKVTVAEKPVNFLQMNVESSVAQGYVDGTVQQS